MNWFNDKAQPSDAEKLTAGLPEESQSDDAGQAKEKRKKQEDAIQVPKSKRKKAKEIYEAPRKVPAGQTRIRLKDSGQVKVVGVRTAAALVGRKRAEYVT